MGAGAWAMGSEDHDDAGASGVTVTGMGGGGVESAATVAEGMSEVVGSAWAGRSPSGCGAGGWGAISGGSGLVTTGGVAAAGATAGLAGTGWEIT